MPTTEWLFDGVLGTLLLLLAIAVLHASRLYTSVVLFIAFGLLLAVAWARLGAPDLALAEAAIGAGLTGALLMAALAQEEPGALGQHLVRPGRMQVTAVVFALFIVGLLLRAVWALADGPTPVLEKARQVLPESGVEHPVTAVLLNFRAWDTFLELLVLLLALLGLRQLRPAKIKAPRPWPLLLAWSRVLAPLTVLVGGYLLWRGATAPGGAFQAGALLAAGAVILRLNNLLPPLRWDYWPIRGLVLLGVLVFLTVGVIGFWLGEGWLVYPPGWAGFLIVLIEVAATLSIATTLTLLVVGEGEELHL